MTKFKSAFTLIELLVVIAIISLLAALLFPVFNNIQENSRQQTTMTSMHEISNGMALFYLDNHTYPAALFGFADGIHPMSDGYDLAQYNFGGGQATSTPKVIVQSGCLFPTYIKDYRVFECPDNPVTDLSKTVTLTSMEWTLSGPLNGVEIIGSEQTPCSETNVTRLDGGSLSGTVPSATWCPLLVPVSRTYFLADAYDISPRIAPIGQNNEYAAGNSAANFEYVQRYAHNWTAGQVLSVKTLSNPVVTYPTTLSSGTYDASYTHQIVWQNPDPATYVTSTTYHIPSANVVIVLLFNGSAVKMTPYSYTNSSTGVHGFDDSTSCYNTVGGTETCTLTATGDNPARFWKIEGQ